MQLEEYKKLLDEKPWQEMENYFNNLPVADIKIIHKLDVNYEDWLQFTIDDFHNVQQKWESPKAHYSDYSNKWASVNNRLGRNEHNTFELNYGMNGDSNDKLKNLLGQKNIEELNVDPDSILMRLIVKMPGHGIAWHQDDAGSYKKKFPNKDFSKLKRLWFSVQDWKDGHAFQISKSVLTHWKAGDVYQIPFGLGHASSNFGFTPKLTVSFTGVFND